MKKWIAVLFTLVSMFSFLLLFNNENYMQLNNMRNAELTSQSYRIIISSDIAEQDQNQVYESLKEIVDEYHANIYFTRLNTQAGSSGYVKYVYCTNGSVYFNKFKLKQGRFFENSEIQSNKFLSTKKGNDKNQIGQIADFAGDNIFVIRTLKSMVNNKTTFDGECIVQFYDGNNVDSFLKGIESKLGVNVEKVNIYKEEMKFIQYIIILISCFLILMLLVLYDILSSYCYSYLSLS